MFNIFKRVSIPNIDAAEFDDIFRNEEKVVILDVRNKKEFDSGHIPGSLHINVQDMAFAKKIEDLDKETHYLVYCRSGRRSMLACRIMDSKGFKQTYNLAGGILKWPHEVVYS